MSAPALESYTAQQIGRLPRRKLQTLCKIHGIKANSKNVKLVSDLQKKLKEIQREKGLPANKENSSSRSNTTSSRKKPVSSRVSTRTNKRVRSQTPSKTQPRSTSKSRKKNASKQQSVDETKNQEIPSKPSSNHNSKHINQHSQPNEMQVDQPLPAASPRKKSRRSASIKKPSQMPVVETEKPNISRKATEIPPEESANMETDKNVTNEPSKIDQTEAVQPAVAETVDTDTSPVLATDAAKESEILAQALVANTNVDCDVNPDVVAEEIEEVSITVEEQAPVAEDADDADDAVNNGSFVDVEIESKKADIFPMEMQQTAFEVTPDEMITVQKLGVSQLNGSNANMEEEEANTDSVSVQYVNHNISSISNENNGSLMGPDVEMANDDSNESPQETPMIVGNDVDDNGNEDGDEDSLSLDKTPKLNDSTEQFIRKSLNPDYQEPDQENTSLLNISIQFEDKEDDENGNNEEQEEEDDDDDDVDMMETPARPATDIDSNTNNNQENVVPVSLEEEIGGVQASPMRAPIAMNTSMLSMSASRITVDSQDHDESNEEDEEDEQAEQTADQEQVSQAAAQQTPVKSQSDKDDSASPEWKHTPFKAMEIFNRLSRSLSQSKSLTNDDDSKQEPAATNTNDVQMNGKAEMDESEDEVVANDNNADDDDDDNEVIKDMDVTPAGNDDEETAAKQAAETTDSSETVENLFYVSPSPITKVKPQSASNKSSEPRNVVPPKSELRHKEKSTSISMTFGDGQKFEFKSVYSPSASMSVSKPDNKNKARMSMERSSTSQQRSITPEVFSEKTMAIRQMMDEAEREFNRSQSPQVQEPSNDHVNQASVSMLEDSSSNTDKTTNVDDMTQQTKRRKSMSAAGSAKKQKRGSVPDWNAIHQKQIFSRQPDLRQWDEARKERAEKLFGANKQIDPLTGNKMSTPGVRQRSKSMVGSRKQANNTHNSEKKPSQKRVTIVPSSNDHKFNQGADSRLNRQIHRAPTPYKHNLFSEDVEKNNIRNTNKRASIKPLFKAAFTEDTIIESDVNDEEDNKHDDGVNGKVESNSNSSSNENSEKAAKIPKKRLAFDPDKVRSRLYQSTNSSSSKMKNRKSSQTPQVKSISRDKILVNRSKIAKQKNWSAVKSKVDTGLFRLPGKKSIDDESMENADSMMMSGEQMSNAGGRVAGIKRKLSWSVSSKSNSNEATTEYEQPAAKKRRMSQQAPNTKRWV